MINLFKLYRVRFIISTSKIFKLKNCVAICLSVYIINQIFDVKFFHIHFDLNEKLSETPKRKHTKDFIFYTAFSNEREIEAAILSKRMNNRQSENIYLIKQYLSSTSNDNFMNLAMSR
ncbi:hypothetical protein BpHYR1_024073 [Brachionus plicatilis]|uniref:Uncharacterized protein n=1 Tax=Brachionus plicatilis TaxID=10195 RepID=A0A3M7P6C0_BRAPC|nr:hypothetical protein BpHYR1_024073 [Brachionus plicatilis]